MNPLSTSKVENGWTGKSTCSNCTQNSFLLERIQNNLAGANFDIFISGLSINRNFYC